MKVAKLAYIGILEDFRVLYFKKVMKLVNLEILIFWKIFMCFTIEKSRSSLNYQNFDLLEDFCVIDYNKVSKFNKHPKFGFWKIFVCSTTKHSLILLSFKIWYFG